MKAPVSPTRRTCSYRFSRRSPAARVLGLALSRQIAEAHGGSFTLQNAAEGPGCEARLVLPL